MGLEEEEESVDVNTANAKNAKHNDTNGNDFEKFIDEGGGSNSLLKLKGMLACKGFSSIDSNVMKL